MVAILVSPFVSNTNIFLGGHFARVFWVGVGRLAALGEIMNYEV
jgi:hypothetical protein